MKNKLVSSIEISEEILSALPKNNVSNTNNYIKEANRIYANYNRVLVQIISEMKQRNKIIDDSLKTEEIEIENLINLKKDLKMLNTKTTSFEKVGLDRLLFNLDPNQGLGLTEINKYIIEVVKVFEEVGIKLSTSDFYYGKVENMYMSTIIDYNNYSYLQTKEIFEKHYWESPNLIENINLNIHSLYFKHQKQFDKYIIDYRHKIKTNYEDLYDLYKNKLINNYENEHRSSKIYLDKFLKGKLDIKDYTEKNITTLSSLILEADLKTKETVIESLKDTLIEYKYYLKYYDLIAEIKANYDELKGRKISTNKILKDIIKLDKKIEKQNKRREDITKNLEKLKDIYKEYNDLYYQERLLNSLNNNSKLLEIFSFLQSFWNFYYQKSKKTNDKITKADLEINFEELFRVYTAPFNNLINHLEIKNGYNIPEIICDKYRLNNIKISEENLELETIETLINNVEILDNYNKILKLEKIDYQMITDYCEMAKYIKEIDEKHSQNL